MPSVHPVRALLRLGLWFGFAGLLLLLLGLDLRSEAVNVTARISGLPQLKTSLSPLEFPLE